MLKHERQRFTSCYVGLAGNPNCGKTTLFNALTGLRAKVGNYPGVTVERKEGALKGTSITILDLPGTYSLSPQSLDEQIARDVLFHRVRDVPPLELVVVVIDASNLQRNLYLATQIIELGYPVIVALNMIDVAADNGVEIDTPELSKRLGVPVIAMTANRGRGVLELRETIKAAIKGERPQKTGNFFCDFPMVFAREVAALAQLLVAKYPNSCYDAKAEASLLLSDDRFLESSTAHYPPLVREEVALARQRLANAQIDWRSVAIEARYRQIAQIQRVATKTLFAEKETITDKLDRILTHKVWGLLIFVALMLAMFQSIFSFAEIPMGWMEKAIEWIGQHVQTAMAAGALNDLLVNGVIAGVGAVLVFLPQICLLFFFIGLLEDTGYMSRAAFLMDRLMSKVGLHGKSFIPMLSSFACAIPGIMATRTIESHKDRLVTILVAPLMSCSARLPVYTVLIAACIPNRKVLGVLGLPALTMLSMYLLGIVVALLMAWLFKKTLLKGPTPMLIMELPPYRRPLIGTVLRHMWDRSKIFIRRAGTVILGISILLWFLASYPKLGGDSGAQLRQSYAGQLGRVLEPAIAPLGFDWKIGIGIIGSFAAREVFVSTMSQVYNIGKIDKREMATRTLAESMRTQRRENGSRLYTPLVAISLMVFYVFALQCVSTVAIVRRETNSWKWPLFQWLYMTALAWMFAFATFQIGRALGFGV
ncbi:MAG TPA: ferrous iron transport protein B [Verrucomicrobiae bacterium]|nr:ferrous iron transport protein B [Verrucomicrobiae bacterium]